MVHTQFLSASASDARLRPALESRAGVLETSDEPALWGETESGNNGSGLGLAGPRWAEDGWAGIGPDRGESFGSENPRCDVDDDLDDDEAYFLDDEDDDDDDYSDDYDDDEFEDDEFEDDSNAENDDEDL